MNENVRSLNPSLAVQVVAAVARMLPPHGAQKRGLGYALRQGTNYEPSHLEIALSGSEHRARGPEIFVGARRQSPEGCILPDFEESAQIGIADFGGGAAVNDKDRLALGII
jgi:hypothetical protein